MQSIDDIKKMVSSGKLDKAITATINIVESLNDTDLSIEITGLSARLNQLNRDQRLNIISYDEHNRSMNRITYALLDFLDRVEDEHAAAPTPAPTPTSTSTPPSIPTPTPPSTSAKKILFLASNPLDTGVLQLEKEHSRINMSLQKKGDKFDVHAVRHVNFTTLLQSIIEQAPNIVHFSGHGQSAQANDSEIGGIIRRSLGKRPEENIDDDAGIILFEEDMLQSELVKTEVIGRLFNKMVNSSNIPIEIVIFNSCFSIAQVKAVATSVPYVIGTNWAVSDKAAIGFTTQFYFGLASNQTVQQSFELGCLSAIQNGEAQDRFVLYKNGEKVVL